jgi:hypothetical protein
VPKPKRAEVAGQKLRATPVELLAAEINTLVEQNRAITVVVSSRPDPNTFSGWHFFNEIGVVPLTKEKCLRLIHKLKYDTSVKKELSTAVEQRLFRTHESFLSNPLLATLMLMTYEQFGSIDERMHVFFAQVFDTLYTKHDAFKVGYRREMYSPLNSDDFRAILSAFCVQTYLSSELTFSNDRALHLIDRAKTIAAIPAPFDSAALLKDLTSSTCLLLQDGLDYSFAHRSLQEYFTASFILRAPSARRRELLQQLRRRLSKDQVASLIFDMERDIFEDEFLLDALSDLRQWLGPKADAGSDMPSRR